MDDYLTYEYVNKGSSPVMESKNVQRPMGVRQATKYSITFSELPSRVSGIFCLIYFSQTEDDVQSVLGISEPFQIRRKN